MDPSGSVLPIQNSKNDRPSYRTPSTVLASSPRVLRGTLWIQEARELQHPTPPVLYGGPYKTGGFVWGPV